MKLKSTQKFNSLLLALTLGCGAAFANTTAMTEVNTIVPDNEVTMIGDNEDAYTRLNVQMTELEELYAKVNSEFQAIAPLMGSDWARTYGNQLAGIQGALNNMRSALETMYANIQLNNQSQLNDYETYKGQLTSLQATVEQAINGYVIYTILPDLTSTISTTMGSNIGNVQSKLNEAGKAEEYADRVNALIAKKAEAQAKLQEYQAAIATAIQAGDYVLAMNTATEAKAYIYGILDEINTECEAILAEAKTVGISSVTFNGQDKSQVYSVNGQRVTTVKKGLYIMNGKKVLVKKGGHQHTRIARAGPRLHLGGHRDRHAGAIQWSGGQAGSATAHGDGRHSARQHPPGRVQVVGMGTAQPADHFPHRDRGRPHPRHLC